MVKVLGMSVIESAYQCLLSSIERSVLCRLQFAWDIWQQKCHQIPHVLKARHFLYQIGFKSAFASMYKYSDSLAIVKVVFCQTSVTQQFFNNYPHSLSVLLAPCLKCLMKKRFRRYLRGYRIYPRDIFFHIFTVFLYNNYSSFSNHVGCPAHNWVQSAN